MVLRLIRDLPGDRAFLPPSSARCQASCAKHHRRLDASVGASGPHDFTVRLRRSRQQHRPRPPHPASTSVTIAKRPLQRGRTHEGRHVSEKTKSGIFFRSGLDDPNQLESAHEIRFFAHALFRAARTPQACGREQNARIYKASGKLVCSMKRSKERIRLPWHPCSRLKVIWGATAPAPAALRRVKPKGLPKLR